MNRSSRILVSMVVLVSTCAAIAPSASAAALPDLIESALTNPPSLTWRGAVIKVTDTVKNAGRGTAKASTTRYYLSKDKVRNSGDIRLSKTRKIPILKRRKTSKGTVSLTIPSTAAGARYFVIACADDLKKVKEKSEKNNCRSSSATTLLDATKPGAPVLGSSPATPSNSTSPSVVGTAEANSSVRLFAGAGCTGTLLGTATAVGGSFSFPVTVTPDSSTVYSATATDPAKNVSACSTTFTYVNDSVAPGPPTITASPPDPSSDETPEWSFSGELNATFECRLTGPGAVDTGFAACPSPKIYDLTDGLLYADGDYTFQVRQIDQAGNPGTLTDERTFFMDSTPPLEPVITDAPTGTVNLATLTFEYSDAFETTTVFECQVTRDGVVVSAFADCGSGPGNHTFDQSTLAADDGAVYEFSVRQLDGVGNRSTSDTASVTVDRYAPPPSVTGPSDPSNDFTPTWSISGETGGTFTCTLSRTGAGTALLDAVGCSDGFSHDLGAEPDDTYTLSVTQTDVLGNPSAPATAVFTLDRDAPDAPAFGGTKPSDVTNVQMPRWAFSGESGATFDCALYESGAPAGPSFDFAPCTSEHEYDVTGLPDSTYTFRVMQTDVAGNPGPVADHMFTLDTELPDAPVFDSTPNAFDDEQNPVWAFSGESTATFECALSLGGTTLDQDDCTSGSYTFDLTAESDGPYTFEVTQTDAAGNTSATATTHVYTLDRVDPEAPTGLGVTPASPSNVDTPTITGSAEAGSSVEIFSDTACTVSESSGIAVGGTFAIPVTVPADSTTEFSARATDPAGNVSPCSTATVTYIEDSTAPDMPAGITSTPNGPMNDNDPAVSGTAEPGSLVRIYGDGACGAPSFLGQGTAENDGAFSISVSVPNDTSTPFHATATDAASNTSACSTSSDTYVEDSTPPAPPTLSLSNPPSPNSDAQPEVLGSAEAGSVVRLYASATCTGTEIGSGTASVFAFPGITVDVPPNTSATIFAKATDEAGNPSGCSSTSLLYENLLSADAGEPGNNDAAGATEVPDLDGNGEPDAVTTWTGTVTLDPVDADWFKFTVPAGANVRAETTDQASAASCAISTNVALYAESDLATPIATDDDVDDGLNDCSLIEGTTSPPPDPGASNLDGTYYLRVSTASIASYRLILTLDAGEYVELEPQGTGGENDAIATAEGPIRNDRVVRGTLGTTSDRDIFKLDLAQGAVVRLETFDLGRNEAFDPATADCAPRPPQALAIGTSVGWSHPVSGATHPFGSGVGIGGISTCGAAVVWAPTGISYVTVQKSASGLAVGDYALQVEILDVGGGESETNDTRATADVITGTDSYVAGDHATIGDVDYWAITVPAGKDVRVELIEGFDISEPGSSPYKEVCEGGGIDDKVSLVGPAGQELLTVDDTGRGSATATRRCAALDGSGSIPEHSAASNLPAGTYYIRVEHGSPLSPASTEAQFLYRLAVTIR